MKDLLNYLGINKKPLESVFTPTNSATINYVKRSSLEKKIDKALKIQGTQLIVYGHSGSGKTTIVRQALYRHKRNFIKTSCISTSTLEELIINAFDKLNPYYTSKHRTKFTCKISSNLKASYSGISSQLGSEFISETSQEFQRVLPVQLSYEKLAEFLGAVNCVWVIDDFHKVADVEKRKLAEVMKAFVDISNDYPNVKIIAIGAVNSPREVVNYNDELKPRLSESQIPLLSFDELKCILVNGAKLLNIQFSGQLIKMTADYSNSLGSICHTLAYNHCDLSNVLKTCRKKVFIDESIMESSIEDYVKDKADTYQQKLDRALKQRAGKYENVKLIINAIIAIDNENVTHNEVLSKIRENEPDYPQGNCTTYLKSLIENDNGEILRYDENSGKYSFSDPFFKAFCKMALVKIRENSNNVLVDDIIQEFLKNIKIEFIRK